MGARRAPQKEDWAEGWMFRDVIAARQVNLDGTIKREPYKPHPKKKDQIVYGKAAGEP